MEQDLRPPPHAAVASCCPDLVEFDEGAGYILAVTGRSIR